MTLAQVVRVAEDVVVLISGICIVGSALVLLKDRRAEGAIQSGISEVPVANVDQFLHAGFVRGASQPSHTLLVFVDFTCPACRAFASVEDSLLARNPSLRVIERNYPLVAIHPMAFQAALAAECAREDGHYQQMRNGMFTRPSLLEARAWGALATLAGISDSAALATCVQSRRWASRVAADTEAAHELEITGTPTLILDSVMFVGGALGLNQLEARLRTQR